MGSSRHWRKRLLGGVCALVMAVGAAAQTRDFDIEQGDLRTALGVYARQSGIQLIYDSDAIQGKKSAGIHGVLSPDDALKALLAGTGLLVQRDESGAVAIRAPLRSKPVGAAGKAPRDDSAAAALPAEEITVTAQKREQRLQDVPISVTAISGADLQAMAIGNLEALSDRQPDFRIAVSPASDYVTIRGVGSSANLGFEQSVGTFVDGVYRGRSRDTRSTLLDLDQVEVLKGPQTTFFGNNTIAGALNITTKKPGDVFTANGDAFYAPDSGEYVTEAGVTLPVDDSLSFRVALRQSGMDGYIKNSQNDQYGPRQNDTVGRVSMAWKPTDKITVDARIDGGRMQDSDVFDIELLQCPSSAAFGAPSGGCARYLAANPGGIDNRLNWHSAANPSFYHYDFAEGVWTTKVDFDGYMLAFKTGYLHHNYDLLNDPAPIPGSQGGSVVGTSSDLPINIVEGYGQFSQEIDFASPTNLPLSYIVGAYYQHGQLNVDLYEGLYFAPIAAATRGLLASSTPIATAIRTRETSNNYSGFAATTWTILDELRLNLGARYSVVDKSDQRSSAMGISGSLPNESDFVPAGAKTQTILYSAGGVDAGNYASPHRSDSKFMPSASLQYDVTAQAMAYVSYSEGFKAGGYSMGTTNSSFAPESVDDYELGIKSTLFDRRMSLDLAGFYSLYRNMQETATVNSGGTVRQIVTNAARSVVKGVELGSAFLVLPELTLKANVAYLSSVYSDYPNGPCTTLQQVGQTNCVQNLSGVSRAFAPKYSGNLGMTYRRAVSDPLDVTLDVNSYFTTRYLEVPSGDYRLSQPGYAKLDLRLAVGPRDDSWQIALIGKNVTNQITASYRQIVPGATGAIGALADPSRSFGVQLSARY